MGAGDHTVISAGMVMQRTFSRAKIMSAVSLSAMIIFAASQSWLEWENDEEALIRRNVPWRVFLQLVLLSPPNPAVITAYHFTHKTGLWGVRALHDATPAVVLCLALHRSIRLSGLTSWQIEV